MEEEEELAVAAAEAAAVGDIEAEELLLIIEDSEGAPLTPWLADGAVRGLSHTLQARLVQGH